MKTVPGRSLSRSTSPVALLVSLLVECIALGERQLRAGTRESLLRPLCDALDHQVSLREKMPFSVPHSPEKQDQTPPTSHDAKKARMCGESAPPRQQNQEKVCTAGSWEGELWKRNGRAGVSALPSPSLREEAERFREPPRGGLFPTPSTEHGQTSSCLREARTRATGTTG